MPPKSYLYFPKYDGNLRVMPAYMECIDSAGVKIVNAHPKNPSRDLPTVMARFIFNYPETGGVPIAVMGADPPHQHEDRGRRSFSRQISCQT